MSETISTSVSAAAIFSADVGCGRPPPKRKDMLEEVGRWWRIGLAERWAGVNGQEFGDDGQFASDDVCLRCFEGRFNVGICCSFERKLSPRSRAALAIWELGPLLSSKPRRWPGFFRGSRKSSGHAKDVHASSAWESVVNAVNFTIGHPMKGSKGRCNPSRHGASVGFVRVLRPRGTC